MRALRSFTVHPPLPEALAPLERLAMNLRWAWDEPTRDLFRWVDPDAWDATRHDPVRLLAMARPERLEALTHDPAFLRFQAEVDDDLERYLDLPRWFQDRDGSPLQQVAYFSPEFGIAEALPQYSGGLGILAGDHLKSASDLGVPLVGVGLFYRHGYFRQGLSGDGWQQERFPDQDPWAMALTELDGVRVRVELGGDLLEARVWRADVGRVPLYLLDADVEENPPELRGVTDRLYGGDVEHRLRQEILLGIGGVRALEELGIAAQVFHTNEGHAGFLGLERMRRAIVDHGLSFAEAVEATRAASIFTTHTPVPAGIDRFPRPLIERYFGGWASECGVTIDELMAIGLRPAELDPTLAPSQDPDGHRDHAPSPAEPQRFNMAVMGLRLAGRSNAVSKLHGAVSREMFADLWPDLDHEEVPIGSVTNGVHAGTWVSADMTDLLARHVLPDWDEADGDSWARVRQVPDDELWRVKEQARSRLVSFVRDRMKQRAIEGGTSAAAAAWTDDLLDPSALTIGFARRFATYKRANLLLAQAERLQALLLDPERPVQFIFAGKAHPADDEGKEMIRQIVTWAGELGVRHRFVFLDDYDIAVARTLYQGADIWLNTPRRPQEACGTSGMKAALNGTLNCSILDGWWDELFDGDNGWAITSAEDHHDLEQRDRLEADSLFDLLEHQIVPLFHDRSGHVPRGWLWRVKENLASLGPAVVASRMVRDYVTELYEPTAAAADALRGDEFARARTLAAWKAHVLASWPDVAIRSVEADDDLAALGSTRAVTVQVALGALTPADVAVEVVHGRVGPHGEIDAPAYATLAPTPSTDAGAGAGDTVAFVGEIPCDVPGRYGLTARVLPAHADLATPVELGRVATP